MEPVTISVFWTFLGLIIFPELVLCVILWMLGHEILAIMALLCVFGTSNTITKTVIKEKFIDNDGKVVEEKKSETDKK